MNPDTFFHRCIELLFHDSCDSLEAFQEDFLNLFSVFMLVQLLPWEGKPLVYLHVYDDLALSESFLLVCAKTWDAKPFPPSRSIAVKGTLVPVLEVADHDPFDISVDGLPVNICLIIKEPVEQLAEALVQIAGAIEAATRINFLSSKS